MMVGMAGGIHDAASVAAFQNGETRLVYARFKAAPADPAYFLQDGTAVAQRQWANEHLECFMPECGDRRLSVVARWPRRRDGFAHRAGAGKHAPESLFHEQGKALIARWACAQDPHLKAVVEQATEDKSRRADVMLTWPDGAHLAVEVQYAGISIAEWRERHESYQRQGIACVWLLGHVGTHLRAPTRQPGIGECLVRLSALHRAMAEEEVPLLWLNPIEETVGTVLTKRPVSSCTDRLCTFQHDMRAFAVAPHEVGDAEDHLEFRVDRLSDSHLDRTGVRTPTLHDLARSRRELLDARARDAELNRQHAADQRVRREEQRRAQQQAYRLQQAALAAFRERHPTPPTRVPPGMLVCPVCRMAMDPILAGYGKHVGC